MVLTPVNNLSISFFVTLLDIFFSASRSEIRTHHINPFSHPPAKLGFRPYCIR